MTDTPAGISPVDTPTATTKPPTVWARRIAHAANHPGQWFRVDVTINRGDLANKLWTHGHNGDVQQHGKRVYFRVTGPAQNPARQGTTKKEHQQ
ncbi:MAG: hypothetical protein GY925_19500 [Actinomycetia bacterium]|nr:hypothetical protein [Actinomycetes bacterium]